MKNHGARWFQRQPAEYDHSHQVCVRSTLSPTGLSQPAILSEQAFRPAARARRRLSHRVFLRYGAWFHLPDLARVLVDGTVTGKLPRTRHVQNGFTGPFTGV